MSNKKQESSEKRPYTLRARAKRREEVHLRITEATVYFHGTVGPARTTMGGIAKHAGVRRATVYNHFPTDLELIDACSSHWFGNNPPPNPAPWAEIADPVPRTRAALEELYEYYHHGQDMLGNVLRDTELVPSLKEIIQLKWWPMLEGIVEILATGWVTPEVERSTMDAGEVIDVNEQSTRPGGYPELRASLRVALDFFTWQKLAESGLSNEKAARLATAWVVAARNLHL